MRGSLHGCFALILLMVALFQTQVAALPTNVKISGLFSVFNPTTGAPDLLGAQELAAFEMAIREINAGTLYPDLLKDPNSNTRILIKRAVRLLDGQFIDALQSTLNVNDWGSDGTIGASTNKISNAIAQISNGYRQNQVAYGSTGSYLSYLGPYPYYFRVCSDDAYQGFALAEVLKYGFPTWTTVTVFMLTGTLDIR